MTDDEVVDRIDNDLRDSGGKRVLYLEGHTDVAPLFALLGQPQTTDAVFDGILVRGLGGHAGSKTVKRYLKIAQEHTHLRRRIFGVVDGDGRSLDELNTTFSDGGPSFDWPSYCIENLLAQVERGWPAAWGDSPDWSDELGRLAPLAAINRLIKTFGDELRAAQLREFWKTSYPRPLATADEMIAQLEQAQTNIKAYPIIHNFQAELDELRALIQRSTAEAHTQINGKWLLKQLARERSRGASEDECRRAWCQAVREAGGHPAVRAWWARVAA